MLDAARLEPRHDVGRSSGHLLHYCPRRSRSNRTTAEHEDRLLSVGPLVKAEGRLEGLSADDQCIHRGHEFLVAMRFNLGWEKIEGAIGSSDEAVEAGANKDGRFHCRVLMLPPNGARISCGRCGPTASCACWPRHTQCSARNSYYSTLQRSRRRA